MGIYPGTKKQNIFPFVFSIFQRLETSLPIGYDGISVLFCPAISFYLFLYIDAYCPLFTFVMVQ
jgi:hypothetical protein